MTQLVDDKLLSGILRGAPPPQMAESVYTTGYWYVRLCQAVLKTDERAGALSRPWNTLPSPVREQAMRALLELPKSIGLLSLRDLGPLIGQHRQRHDLNILGMEALAAAVRLDAEVCLSAPSPRLEEALGAEGRRVRIIA